MKDVSELSEDERLAILALNRSTDNIAKAEDWAEDMRTERDAALVGLRKLGWTIADCADLSGLSESLVHKISVAGGVGKPRTARKAAAKKAAR